MCGICGVISSKIDTGRRNAVVQEMNNAILHRGPDEDGFFSDDHCTLAMRRLSIIDLNTGKQPIYSNNGKTLIFFNGEIYNYPELKNDLISKGIQFHTTSDTEVVVNLYQQYGTDMLLMLKGMFAFCIYDITNESYFFARDRFGEKPFFYYHNNESLFFSSEINSLLTSPEVPRRLNKSLLGVYLRRSYVPEPDTLFENIKILPVGHYLIYNRNGLQIKPYFTVQYNPDNSINSIEDAAAYIKPFLESAVKRQMISDVPIGAFLSGGIDSSTVVALMQEFSDRKIKTFNVKFQTEGYDESKIARKVAEKVGTEHHEIVVANSSFNEDQFWKILRHTGVPFPDSSAMPTDIVTKEIVKHVKVALSGDGGDELFAGYNIYDWFSYISKLKRIPDGLRKLTELAIGQINNTRIGSNQLRQVSKAINISRLDPMEMLEEMHALFDSKEIRELYDDSFITPKNSIEGFENMSNIRKAMSYRIKYDLPLDMLIKVDRMSMSNSLEVRNPFLDPDLFDASTKLPDLYLRKNGIGKLVIREIMKNKIPRDVFEHPKSGFSIPLHDFQNESFKQIAHDLLLNQEYMRALFHINELEEIVNTGLNETKNSNTGSIYRKTHQLWSLMMLSGWIKMYEVEV